MIVLARDDRLLLIRQLDHAALAGRFAEAWGGEGFEAPSPRDAVVLAAGRHDEGWREWDDELRFDAARHRPLYFLDVDIHDYVRLYSRGIQRIAELDPYAGILVSMHGTGNVCGRWGAQRGIRLSGYDERTWPPVIESYVLEQEALQARLKLGLLGLNPEARRSDFERRLWSTYELLQAWDRLSLFLCRTDPRQEAGADLGEVPAASGSVERTPLAVASLGGGRATVTPWPFAQPELVIEIPVRAIPDHPYETSAGAAGAAARAGPEHLGWRLSKETA